MKTRTTAIILAMSLCAALLSGCGGGSSTASSYEPAVPAASDTASEGTYSTGESLQTTSPASTENAQEDSSMQEAAPSFVDNVSVPAAKLSDGPIFMDGNFSTGFNLYQINVQNGETKEIASFSIGNGSYQFAFDPGKVNFMPSYFLRELFDADLTKLAVGWYDRSDNSNHVGWIDKGGKLTDVTSIIHPHTSAFSSKVPKDMYALFSPDGYFFFSDENDDLYYYIDPVTLNVVKTEYVMEDSYNSKIYQVIFMPEGNMIESFVNNNPGSSSVEVADFGEYKIGLPGPGYGFSTHDYSGDGQILCTGTNSSFLAKIGKDINELYVDPYQPDKFTFYRFQWKTEICIRLTPTTDYKIENCCYLNGQIAFVASRGNERYLFSMYDENKEVEPQIVTSVPGNLSLLFWLDSDSNLSIPSSGSSSSSDAKSYTTIENFSIDGKWKNVGTYTFGQVQDGAIVVFDGTYCNMYSPRDTYALYKDGDSYRLDTTSLLGEPTSFTVKIVDKDNIDVYYGSNYLELTRVS